MLLLAKFSLHDSFNTNRRGWLDIQKGRLPPYCGAVSKNLNGDEMRK